MRWSALVVVALLALASAEGCGRSKSEATVTSAGGSAGRGGGSGGSGGSTGGAGGRASGGAGTGGAGAGGTDLGSGGCADTRADCACDSVDPECVSARESLCLFGACPPTLDALRDPDHWLRKTGIVSATLTECADRIRTFSVSFIDSGLEASFDPSGNLVYEASHESCNTPLCGQVKLSNFCRSCVLAPVDTFPPAGEGAAGQPSTPEVYASCQLDENGMIALPPE